MNQKINLKKLEKKAWTKYFEDGLWDIFFGIMLLTTVIRTITDNVWFTFLIFSGVLIMIAGKRYMTVPRIGLVKFGPEREMKRIKLIGIIGIAVIITFILFLAGNSINNPPKMMFSFIIAALVVVIFAFMAYYLEYFRLALYGILFAIGEILWSQFGESIGLMAMFAFGSTILIIGLITLVLFMRENPLPSKGAMNGS